MADQIGSGTARGLIEYLNSLVERGRARQGVIAPLRISFSKVMSEVDGQNWEKTDIRSIDVDDYMSRFANLTMGSYSSGSLHTYGVRVKKAINWYTTFLQQPGWSPDFKSPVMGRDAAAKKQDGKAGKERAGLSKTEPPVEAAVSDQEKSEDSDNKSTADGLIAYPFPLTTGKLITLYLPVTIRKVDAQRISAFLQTLVVEGGAMHENADAEH